MWRVAQLYTPVLFPSWRFFEEIGAGVRVDYQRGNGPWTPATVTPPRSKWPSYLVRLVWNPTWNERLYLVTLAECVLTGTSAKASDDLARRLFALSRGSGPLAFRIRLIDADSEVIAFKSTPYEF